jgi:hypothetical protein
LVTPFVRAGVFEIVGLDVPDPAARTDLVATFPMVTDTDADSRGGVRTVIERSLTRVTAVDGSALPSTRTRTMLLSLPKPRPAMTYPQFVTRAELMDGDGDAADCFAAGGETARVSVFRVCGAAFRVVVLSCWVFCDVVFAGVDVRAFEDGTVTLRVVVVLAGACAGVLLSVFCCRDLV